MSSFCKSSQICHSNLGRVVLSEKAEECRLVAKSIQRRMWTTAISQEMTTFIQLTPNQTNSIFLFVSLVPPDISNEDSSVDMSVQEGEDATLTCTATGNPQPRVTWKKEDGDFIYVRKHGNRDLMKGINTMYLV